MNMNARVLGVVGAAVALLAVGCGSSPGSDEGVAQAEPLKCAPDQCNTPPPPPPPPSKSSCYAGSYQGDTLQTLSTQGTLPGSVGVCASALLAHGCTKVGDKSSTLAVPYYMASQGQAFLAIQCPPGTIAALNRDERWSYGSFPNYGGYVWYGSDWAYLESNYLTQSGTLYSVAPGTGGAIPVSKGAVIAYNVSTNWTGWAWASSCSSHPAWLTMDPGGSLYMDGYPCLTASAGYEIGSFDPTCGSHCM